MRLRDIAEAVQGEVLCGQDRLDENVDYAFASDLMSDVLTIKTDDFLLITEGQERDGGDVRPGRGQRHGGDTYRLFDVQDFRHTLRCRAQTRVLI